LDDNVVGGFKYKNFDDKANSIENNINDEKEVDKKD